MIAINDAQRLINDTAYRKKRTVFLLILIVLGLSVYLVDLLINRGTSHWVFFRVAIMFAPIIWRIVQITSAYEKVKMPDIDSCPLIY